MKAQTRFYIAIVLILILVTVAGYSAFLLYVSNTQGISIMPLMIVAVIAGIATFFSPCSFGLLPSYLSFYSTSVKKTKSKRYSSNIKYGILAASGLASFNLILGLIIALFGSGLSTAFSVAGGGSLAGITLIIRGMIGSILFILGLLQFFHISIVSGIFHKIAISPTAKNKNRNPLKGIYLYGFGYNLGNIGCTGPILAGLIVLALGSGFNATLAAFGIYSLTMAILMIFVSVLVGFSKNQILENLQTSSGKIMKIGGIVLMAAGLFVIWTVIYPEQFASIFFPKP